MPVSIIYLRVPCSHLVRETCEKTIISVAIVWATTGTLIIMKEVIWNRFRIDCPCIVMVPNLVTLALTLAFALAAAAPW